MDTTPQIHTKGPVPPSPDTIHIERPANSELLEALAQGEYCNVLGPRQIGKTTLLRRTQERLRAQGSRCVYVDLNGIGRDGTDDGFHFSLLSGLAEGLLEFKDRRDFNDWRGKAKAVWAHNQGLTVTARWRDALHELVLDQLPGRKCVALLDEIELTMVLPFRDDLLAAIRALHALRDKDPWDRLTICLCGAVAPLDLIQEPTRTPYNIGTEIRLDDYTLDQARQLLPGLARLGAAADEALEAVMHWTVGHPAMTNEVCWHLARWAKGAGLHQGPALIEDVRALVEQVIRREFLDRSMPNVTLLVSVENHFDMLGLSRQRSEQQIALEQYGPRVLARYRQALETGYLPLNLRDVVQQHLRIVGMMAQRNGRLELRNKVFAQVFNLKWVEEKTHDFFEGEPLGRWLASGRDPAYLLRGDALQGAWELAQNLVLTEPEMEFLRASEHGRVQELKASERRRRQRLISRFWVALTLLLLVSVGLGFRVFMLRQERVALELEAARLRFQKLALETMVAELQNDLQSDVRSLERLIKVAEEESSRGSAKQRRAAVERDKLYLQELTKVKLALVRAEGLAERVSRPVQDTAQAERIFQDMQRVREEGRKIDWSGQGAERQHTAVAARQGAAPTADRGQTPLAERSTHLDPPPPGLRGESDRGQQPGRAAPGRDLSMALPVGRVPPGPQLQPVDLRRLRADAASWDDERRLRKAKEYYYGFGWDAAMALARMTVGNTAHAAEAWRFIGCAACYKGDLESVQQALRNSHRLETSPEALHDNTQLFNGSETIAYVCQRTGIECQGLRCEVKHKTAP